MLKLAVLFLLFVFPFTGCGKKSDGEPEPKAPIGNILVDAYVPTYQRNALAQSLNYLDSIPSWPQDNSLLQMTGLSTISSESLHRWLEERVHYILASNFNLQKRAFIAQDYYAYDFPNVLPDMGQSFADFGPQIIMSNMGTSLYLTGKMHNSLIGLHVSRLPDVYITSPRAGVVQVTEPLFYGYQNNPPSNIFLLMVLFHEARHSDGRGKSLGFTHTKCPPKKKRYAGLEACDSNVNGPYSVEAEMAKVLIQTCATCTARDLENLKGKQLDSLYRVLALASNGDVPVREERARWPASVWWEDQPEGRR